MLFAANIVWSIIFLSTQNSVCDPEQDDIQMCQEQIDRLSYIISLSHINYIERKRIRIGGALIPISDSYLPLLMSKLCLQI